MIFMDSSKANYALENFDKKLELRKIPCPGRYKIPTSNNPKWPACANKRQMIDLELKKKERELGWECCSQQKSQQW